MDKSWIQDLPEHEYNETLVKWAAPQDWVNPTADGVYNMVIIGAGSGGLVVAAGAAQLGAKVAIIEKSIIGGDCLNVGCMPSKAIIRAAKTIGYLNKGKKFGIEAENVKVDFRKVMEHVYWTRAQLAPHDSADRYTKMGVDVYYGDAHFTGPNTIEIDDQVLEFKKATIATGSRPVEIPINGLKETGFITNETLWHLTEQPASMAIIGAGPIGAEMAQAFQRLGTQVTLIDIAPQILGREDRDAAEIVQAALVTDGVEIVLGAKTQRVYAEDGKKMLEIEHNGETKHISVDEIMLSVGRAPNLEGLNLEAAGVEYHRKGLVVDDYLQTTNPDIYGAGDVALKYQFTHAAGHSAAIVVQNALFADFVPIIGSAAKRKVSDMIMPWATYTDPEVAHIGAYPSDLDEQGIAYDTYQVSAGVNDRAIAEAAIDGFIKVHTKKGGDKILGATIVGSVASELLSEIAIAMKYNLGLGKLRSVVMPYPTQSEIIQKVANEHAKTLLTAGRQKILGGWMNFTR